MMEQPLEKMREREAEMNCHWFQCLRGVKRGVRGLAFDKRRGDLRRFAYQFTNVRFCITIH